MKKLNKRHKQCNPITLLVSDVSFTIFKDLDGDYVTRYTSLKDGQCEILSAKSFI